MLVSETYHYNDTNKKLVEISMLLMENMLLIKDVLLVRDVLLIKKLSEYVVDERCGRHFSDKRHAHCC